VWNTEKCERWTVDVGSRDFGLWNVQCDMNNALWTGPETVHLYFQSGDFELKKTVE